MDPFYSKSNLEFNYTSGKNYAVLVKNLSKTYGTKEPILKNVSMKVEEGIVYGLLGASGCGKTSLLSCVLSLKTFEKGSVFLFGKKVEQEGGIRWSDVGYMPQDIALYDQLTVGEMMKYYSRLYGMSDKEFQTRTDFLEELVDLPGFRSRRITNLSGGQKRRVSLSLTLIHNPKLLILDEPTVGLDPLLRERLWNYLFNLTKTSKTTIVITTHYIEEVRRANKCGIMRKGRLLVEDDPITLQYQYNTPLLEDIVRKICYKDAQSHGFSSRNSIVNGGIQALIKDEKQNPVNLLHFSRKESTESRDFSEVIISKKNDVNVVQSPLDLSDLKVSNCLSGDSDVYTYSQDATPTSLSHSIRKSLAYSKVVWINFLRHPIFVFLVLFLPPFQLFTTGIVFGVEPKFTPIGIVNYEIPHWESKCAQVISGNVTHEAGDCDLSSLSCALIKQLYPGDFIRPVEFLSRSEAHHAVQQGLIRGYVQIPVNFSSYISERAALLRFASHETVDGTSIKMNMDMADFITMYVVLMQMFDGFSKFVKDLTYQCNFDLRIIDIPFDYRDPVYGNFDGSAQDYALPALIAGILFEIAFTVTPLVLVNDMKSGTLERSKTAGLRFVELMTGLIMTMSSVAFLQAVICYFALEYGLNFTIHGNVLVYGVLCFFAALVGGTLGLLVGVIFKDAMIVIIMAVCILPVLMVHVGILRPEEVLPSTYRSFVYYVFPSAAIVRSFRFVMNRGLGLLHPQVWPGMMITLGWSSFFALISLILIRRSKS